MTSSDNIVVAIKARPLIQREKNENSLPHWHIQDHSIFQLDLHGQVIGEPYSFDHVFNTQSTNQDVYNGVVKNSILAAMEGFNMTIFAYGQTSSGKTYTMMGDDTTPGLIQLSVNDIFNYIEEHKSREFLIRCSFFEIYNEHIYDLLDRGKKTFKELRIKEDRNGNVGIEAREIITPNPSAVLVVMKQGNKNRKIGSTKMNERSSRSHTILRVTIESKDPSEVEGRVKLAHLHLVDLAGSERVAQTKAEGKRLQEGVNINKSLSALGHVIRQLSDQEGFVSYRDSKLTRLLQSSLGGNAKALMITTITLAVGEETRSSLEFSQRAKIVKNKAIINEVKSDRDNLKNLFMEYRARAVALMEKVKKAEEDKQAAEAESKQLREGMAKILGFDEHFSDLTILPKSKKKLRRFTVGSYEPSREACPELPTSFLKQETQALNQLVDLLDHKVEGTETSEIDERDQEGGDIDPEPGRMPTIMEEAEPEFLRLSPIPTTPKRLSVPSSVDGTPAAVWKMRHSSLEESYLKLKEFTSLEQTYAQEDGGFVQRIINEKETLCENYLKLQKELMEMKERNEDKLKNEQKAFDALKLENANLLKQLTELSKLHEQLKVHCVEIENNVNCQINDLQFLLDEQKKISTEKLNYYLLEIESNKKIFVRENDKLAKKVETLQSLQNESDQKIFDLLQEISNYEDQKKDEYLVSVSTQTEELDMSNTDKLKARIVELENESADLKSSNFVLEDLLDIEKQQRGDLENISSQMKMELDEFKSEIETLKSKNDENKTYYENELNILWLQVNQLEKENSDLLLECSATDERVKLKEEIKEITYLKQLSKELGNELEKAKKENQQLIGKHDVLLGDLEEKRVFQQNLKNLYEENEVLLKRIDEITSEKEQQISKTISENEQLILDIKILNKNLEEAALREQEVLKECQIIKKELNEKCSDNAKLSNNLKEIVLEKEVIQQQLSSENENLIAQIKSLNETTFRERETLKDSRDIIDELNEKCNEIAKLNKHLKETVAQNEIFEQQLSKTIAEKENWIVEIKTLNESLTEAIVVKQKTLRESEMLRDEINEKCKENTKLYKDLKETVVQKELVEQQLSNTTSEIDNYIAQIEILNKSVNEAAFREQETLKEIGMLQKKLRENARLSNDMKETVVQKDILENELLKAVAENENLMAKIQILNENFTEAVIVKEQTLKDCGMVRSELYEKYKENAKLTKDLKETVAQKEFIEQQLSKITSENDNYIGQIEILNKNLSVVTFHEQEMLKEIGMLTEELEKNYKLNKDMKETVVQKEIFEQQLSKAVTDKENLIAEIQILNKNLSEAVIAKQQTLKESEMLRVELNEKSKENAKFAKDLKEILVQKEVIELKLSKTTSEIDDYIAQIEILKKSLNEAAMREQETLKEIGVLKDELKENAKLSKDMKETVVQKENFEQQLSKAVAEKENLLAEIQILSENLSENVIVKQQTLKENEMLRDKLNEKCKENANFSKDLKETVIQKEVIEQQLSKTTSENDKYVAQIEILNKNLNEAALREQVILKEIGMLTDDLKKNYKEIAKLSKDMKETIVQKQNFEQQLSKAATEKENLIAEIQILNENLSEAAIVKQQTLKENKMLKDKLNDICDENTKLVKDLKEIVLEKEVIEQQLSKTTFGTENHIAQIEILNKNLNEAALREQEALKKIGVSKDELKQKYEENAKLSKNLREIVIQKEQLEHQLLKVIAVNENLIAEIKTLTETPIIGQETLKEVAMLRNELTDRCKKNSKLDKELKELVVEKVDIEQQLLKATSENERCTTKIKILMEELRKKYTENEMLSKDLKEAVVPKQSVTPENTADQLKQIDVLKNELDLKSKDYSKLSKQFCMSQHSLNTTIRDLKEKLKNQEELALMQLRQIQKLEVENENLKHKVRQLDDEKIKYKKKMEDQTVQTEENRMKNEMTERKKKIHLLHDSRRSLSFSEDNEDIEILKEDLNQLQKENKKKSDKIKHMQRELEELASNNSALTEKILTMDSELKQAVLYKKETAENENKDICTVERGDGDKVSYQALFNKCQKLKCLIGAKDQELKTNFETISNLQELNKQKGKHYREMQTKLYDLQNKWEIEKSVYDNKIMALQNQVDKLKVKKIRAEVETQTDLTVEAMKTSDEKYRTTKIIANMRREENTKLKAKLGMSADDPVS